MSKMTKPTADVVRFKENDVIVASVVLFMSGFGMDNEIHNGKMRFNGQSVEWDDERGYIFPSDFVDYVTAGRGNAVHSDFADTTIDNLFEADWGDVYDYAHADDGYYVWNDSAWVLRRRNS